MTLIRIPSLSCFKLGLTGKNVKANQLKEILIFRKEQSIEAQKLAQHGLWEEAELAYYGIVEQLPGDDSAHINRARALLNLSREDEAAEHLQASNGLQKVKEDRTKKAVQHAVNFSWKGAAIAAAVVAFPLLVRSIRLGFDTLDPKLEEAARTEFRYGK